MKILSNIGERLGIRAANAAYYQTAVSDGIGATELVALREGDAREIEALYRATTLAALRPREGRARDLAQLIGTTVGEGLYICDALQHALEGPGDICEFGVAQGATSRLLARELMADARAQVRSLWLFDSFEGLPRPTAKDRLLDDIFKLGNMAAYEGTMRCARSLVETKLRDAGFPAERTQIKEGWVERTIREAPLPAAVCFAYVDFDFYQPIADALAWLDTVTGRGSRVIVDDYGFFSEGAQIATDEFVAATGGRWKFSLPAPSAGKFALLERV
jgi:O-methyltransferase